MLQVYYITVLLQSDSSRNTANQVQTQYTSGKGSFSNAVFLKSILWRDQLKENKATFKSPKTGTFVRQKEKIKNTIQKPSLIITEV